MQRKRLWIETALSACSAVLCALTLAWPDWIEGIFGCNPDHHDGTYELLIIAGLFVTALATGWTARRTRRRGAALGVELPRS